MFETFDLVLMFGVVAISVVVVAVFLGFLVLASEEVEE